MKIYRGGREIDSKEPGDYIQEWKTGQPIWLNGTIDGHERFAHFGLRIEDPDVIALFYALIERYQESEEQAKTVAVCAEAITRLATASQQIAMKVETLEAMRKQIRDLTYSSDKSLDDRLREIRAVTRRKSIQPGAAA
jgi:hypothetical protein